MAFACSGVAARAVQRSRIWSARSTTRELDYGLNFLVTLHQAAADLLEAAGAPPEGLVPLMTRTIENAFELTGPIERGDWETVEAHLAAIRERRPELEPLYRALADATAALVVR